MKSRTYTSALREQQAEQTRQRIIEALVAQVFDLGLAEFSVPQVAREAGVSTRTVYRYFPTRDDLLAAVGQHMEQTTPGPTWPAGRADLERYVRDLFFWFEANQKLVEAAYITRLGRDVHQRMRRDRWQRVRHLIAELAGPGDPDGVRRFGPISVLMSSQSWLSMTRDLGLTTAEAADAACHVIRGILDEHAAELADRTAAPRRRQGGLREAHGGGAPGQGPSPRAPDRGPWTLRGLFLHQEIDL